VSADVIRLTVGLLADHHHAAHYSLLVGLLQKEFVAHDSLQRRPHVWLSLENLSKQMPCYLVNIIAGILNFALQDLLIDQERII